MEIYNLHTNVTISTGFIADPFEFRGCDIPSGVYITTYSPNSTTSNQCSGDKSSVVTVSGSQMEIKTCYSGAVTYGK